MLIFGGVLRMTPITEVIKIIKLNNNINKQIIVIEINMSAMHIYYEYIQHILQIYTTYITKNCSWK